MLAQEVPKGFVGELLEIHHPVAPQQIEPFTVQRIGELLMTGYVWPLLCVGVLLTAALIGALILVMEDRERS